MHYILSTWSHEEEEKEKKMTASDFVGEKNLFIHITFLRKRSFITEKNKEMTRVLCCLLVYTDIFLKPLKINWKKKAFNYTVVI